MAFTKQGNVSSPISDPTILKYRHVHSQLKCTEDGISIENNNSAQFSVTDVRYDKDFSVA
jgi:hypothetical protein